MKRMQKVFAMLLTLSMLVSLLGVTAFAADRTSAEQIVANGGKIYYLANGEEASADNFDVWTSKSIAGTDKEDEFEVTLQVGTTMKAIPNDVAVVLVVDVSGSMMADENGTMWYNNNMPADKRPRIEYAREAALEFAETYVENSGNAQRMLSVVQFGNNAATVLPWTDVNAGGELKASAKDAIESVDVNFLVEADKDYWDVETAMVDFGKVDYWDASETPAEMADEFKDYFQSYCQAAVMKDCFRSYFETVQQEVEGVMTDVSVCMYPDCANETAGHTHCAAEGCAVSETHQHCETEGCTETAGHVHCSECTATAEHKHCAYDGCDSAAEHKHCAHEGCTVAAAHSHCKRCGLTTEDHNHVVGCTLKKCKAPYDGPHIHACVHGGDSMDPYYCIHSRYSHEYPYRCTDPTPEHTHDLLDADRYCLVTDKYFGAVWNVGTNMEGGLMLARNLVNAGLADGGAIEGIDDVYVVLLSDGNPTWVSCESSTTELEFLKGEKDLTSNSKWAAIEEIVFSGEEGDAAIVEDIKDKAELCAILYGTSVNSKLGGSHELANITGAEWFKGTGKNYIGADLVVDSPESNGIDEAFLAINDRIDVLAKAWTVTDALSEDVSFGEFTLGGDYAGYAPASGDAAASVSWSLGRMTPEQGNGTMADPYIYTMKYTVTLNSAEDDVKAASLAHDADPALDGVWTGDDATLQYFMITKEELDTMDPAEICELLCEADFEDVSVKGIYGDFSFTKLNGETEEVMEGAGFTLYDSEGKAYGEEVFSDAEGKVAFTDIPRGTYTLKETTVPEGMAEMEDVALAESWGSVTAADGSAAPSVIYNYVTPPTDPDPDPNPRPNPRPDPDPDPSGDDEVEIEDPRVPLGGDVEIPDEEPPKADVPKTGDASVLWLATAALSGCGLLMLRRKSEDEET